MYEWLWSALRMQEDCILRALNFKFSWGTQNPGSTLAQTGNDPQIEPQMIPNRKWSHQKTRNGVEFVPRVGV